MGEIVGTFKPSGEPWIVIHAANAAEYVAMVNDALNNGVFEATGLAVQAVRTRTLLGSELGAQHVSTEPNPAGAAPQQAPPPFTPPEYQQAPPAQWGQQAPQQGYGQQYPQQQGYAPQGAAPLPQLPPGEPETKPCPHGGKTWKAGYNKQQKPYGGWFCGGPRGNQCAPEFPRR